MTHSFEHPTFSSTEAELRNRVVLDGVDPQADPQVANLTFSTLAESGIRTDRIERMTITPLVDHPLQYEGGLIAAPKDLAEQTPLARIKGAIRSVGESYSVFGGDDLESTYGEEGVAERQAFYKNAAEQADRSGIYVNDDHAMLANMHESGLVGDAEYLRATEMLLVEAAVTDREGLRAVQVAQQNKLAEMNPDFQAVNLVSTGDALEGVDRSVKAMFKDLDTAAQIDAHAAKLASKRTNADELVLAA